MMRSHVGRHVVVTHRHAFLEENNDLAIVMYQGKMRDFGL